MHQAIDLQQAPPPPGSIDVWDEFYRDPEVYEVGGLIKVTSARTFLYYLASAETRCAMVTELLGPKRKATVRAYGPICDEGGPLYVEQELSGSARDHLYKSYVPRLCAQEILLLREKLKEHVLEKHHLFPKNGQCSARTLLTTLGLPWLR